jgi:hypothetical protein
MSDNEKLLHLILLGRQDASFKFADIDNLLLALGFSRRIKGDHHIYYREGVAEIINLQPIKSKAKDYQVKQIRNIILKYGLAVQ